MVDRADTAASALADFVPRLARIIASTLQSDPAAAMTIRQYRILERLQERPHRTAELASTSDISQPTASNAIAGLEARDLVRRRPDPEDGRATLIELTEQGRAIYLYAHDIVIERLATFTEGLGPEATASLERLAADLNERMDVVRQTEKAHRAQPIT